MRTMDISSQFFLTNVPSAPGLESILRPIVLDDALQVQTFFPLATPSLDAVAVASAMPQSMVLAQQFDQDILGDMGKLWSTFIESGQVWALLIGVVVGYFIRSLTAY
jgi:hypothetical protein